MATQPAVLPVTGRPAAAAATTPPAPGVRAAALPTATGPGGLPRPGTLTLACVSPGPTLTRQLAHGSSSWALLPEGQDVLPLPSAACSLLLPVLSSSQVPSSLPPTPSPPPVPPPDFQLLTCPLGGSSVSPTLDHGDGDMDNISWAPSPGPGLVQVLRWYLLSGCRKTGQLDIFGIIKSTTGGKDLFIRHIFIQQLLCAGQVLHQAHFTDEETEARAGKSLAQGHAVGKWQGWNLSSGG